MFLGLTFQLERIKNDNNLNKLDILCVRRWVIAAGGQNGAERK
jgi:hypothetical protein